MAAPLTPEEVRRRVQEEMHPETPGPQARPQWQDRLREDIWVGVSGGRTHIPREEAPDVCPSCGRSSLAVDRVIEQA